MQEFNTSPASPDYPKYLREIRQRLDLSQSEFAVAAGYSAVMQGRYETDRLKNNSAIPSEKTARAIKAMIALAQAKREEAQGLSATPIKPLKAFSMDQFEQAVRSAFSELTGAPCTISIKDVVFETDDKRMTMSMMVSQKA